MKFVSILLLFAILSMALGCVVRTGPTYRRGNGHSRACPPAYHWDGYACVHNGKGKHKGHRR